MRVFFALWFNLARPCLVSAGIAHNRMLAKLTSGMNKPYAQTLIPMSRVPAFFAKLPLSKVCFANAHQIYFVFKNVWQIRGLGGKFGVQLQQDMGIEFVGQLAAATPASLMRHYDEKTVAWLRRLSQVFLLFAFAQSAF
jgi:DNA polymerase eta